MGPRGSTSFLFARQGTGTTAFGPTGSKRPKTKTLMGKRLYVGNLSYQSTADDVREAFEAGGKTVTDVFLMMDRETGRPRGFAFAEMASEADAQSAIEALEGSDLDGRTIRVNEARERQPRGGGGNRW